MEQPVPKRVHLQIGDRIRRVGPDINGRGRGRGRGAGEHVVPLQNLKQQDPIDESTQPDTEDGAG